MIDARFRLVDMTGARFEQVNMSGVVMRGVTLFDVDTSGEVWNLPFDEMKDEPVVPRDRDARPSLEEVHALRGTRVPTLHP